MWHIGFEFKRLTISFVNKFKFCHLGTVFSIYIQSRKFWICDQKYNFLAENGPWQLFREWIHDQLLRGSSQRRVFRTSEHHRLSSHNLKYRSIKYRMDLWERPHQDAPTHSKGKEVDQEREGQTLHSSEVGDVPLILWITEDRRYGEILFPVKEEVPIIELPKKRGKKSKQPYQSDTQSTSDENNQKKMVQMIRNRISA